MLPERFPSFFFRVTNVPLSGSATGSTKSVCSVASLSIVKLTLAIGSHPSRRYEYGHARPSVSGRHELLVDDHVGGREIHRAREAGGRERRSLLQHGEPQQA